MSKRYYDPTPVLQKLKAGETYDTLAEAGGISHDTIRRAERVENLSIKSLIGIAKATKCKLVIEFICDEQSYRVEHAK
jgi:hypothetical protein